MQGWSALHSAVSSGHDDVVQRLLSLGADVAAQTSGGQTPLHYAVRGEVPSPATTSIVVKDLKAFSQHYPPIPLHIDC